MFSFVHKIKDQKTAELLVDSLGSYRLLYDCNGSDSLRLFLRGAASSYVEVTAHSGVGYTSVFQFENELSDFEFTAALDPQHVLGPKGLQVQVEGLGLYLGFLASMSLSGRKLLFVDSGRSATFRAKAISRILLTEFNAIAYDQMPISKAYEVQSANL